MGNAGGIWGCLPTGEYVIVTSYLFPLSFYLSILTRPFFFPKLGQHGAGDAAVVSRIIYSVVGISALWLLLVWAIYHPFRTVD